VTLPGLSDRLSANYSAGTAQGFGEAGYQFAAGPLGLEPFFNLAYVNLHTEGFSENGGATALTARSSSMNTAFSTLGLRASLSLPIGSAAATLHGMLGWRHSFGDITPISVVSLAGSDAFSVRGLPIAKNAAVIEAGVAANLSGRLTVGISYGGQFGSKAVDHSVQGTVRLIF
jgi:outer membrane autotransporter protein